MLILGEWRRRKACRRQKKQNEKYLNENTFAGHLAAKGKSKQELLRIVRSPDMTVSVDKTGKKAGRGAYICPNAECLKKARKSHRLEKNLACEISNEIYDAIEAEFVKNE